MFGRSGGGWHHASTCPERGGCDVRHNDCILALCQPWLHGWLILKHVQACEMVAWAYMFVFVCVVWCGV